MPVSKTFRLGTRIDPAEFGPQADAPPEASEPLTLDLDDFKVHALVAGSSGSGKSRAVTALALDAFAQHVPTVVIDKHGDTVDDIAAHVAARAMRCDPAGTCALLRRLHFLEWGPLFCPRLDPFHFPPPAGLHRDFLGNALTAAREALVDQVSGHLQSSTQGKEGFEGTPRLQRQLKNGLLGCTRPSPHRRLPFGLVPTLLNVLHPRHAAVFARVAPTLPAATRADFDHLHEVRPERAFEQVESALNRTSAFFSTLLSESFGATSESASVLDLGGVIRRGHLLLVNLRETPYFSHSQGVTLGRLMATSVVETLMRLPRAQRTAGCLLVIEEAGEVIHEPFLRYLGAVRKYGCRMVFCGQDLATFRKATVDLVPKLLSQVGLVVTFNQRFPADAAVLSELLFQGSVDRTPLVHAVEREGPLRWLQVEDTSASGQTARTHTTGTGVSTGTTATEQQTESVAHQNGWTSQESSQDAEATGESSGTSRATGATTGESLTPVDAHGRRDERRTVSGQHSTTLADTRQTTATTTHSRGSSVGESGSETQTHAVGTSRGRSAGQSRSESDAVTSGEGWSVSKRWVHLATKVREVQETGQLKSGPTAEQLAARQAVLMELPPRVAVVKRAGSPAVFVRTRDVPDAFATPQALARSV